MKFLGYKKENAGATADYNGARNGTELGFFSGTTPNILHFRGTQ